MKKMGMLHEGVKRKSYRLKTGEFVDMNMYSIIGSDAENFALIKHI